MSAGEKANLKQTKKYDANGKFVYFSSVRLISLTCKAQQNPASFDKS